jgi:hypothetical protein
VATSSRHRASVGSARRRRANPRGKRIRYQRHELVAAAGGAVLVVVIAVLSAWAHHSLSTVPPASPHAASAQPAAVGPQPPSPPMRSQLRAWFNDVEPSIDALLVARDKIMAPAAQGDFAATGAACQSAGGAISNIQQHLPSPDPTVNTILQQALSHYQVGIRHCIAGAEDRDAVDIGEATVFVNQGHTDLQKAVDIIASDLSSDARDPRLLTGVATSELVTDGTQQVAALGHVLFGFDSKRGIAVDDADNTATTRGHRDDDID